MKKTPKTEFLDAAKTLSLHKETLRMLNEDDLSQAPGGMDGSGQTGCRPIATGCRTL